MIEKKKKKILKTGTYSYMITLPKEWIKKMKLRSKQTVVLEYKNSCIIIRHDKKESKKRKI